MNANLKKIIERVRKLMALGESPNKGESEAAIFRAQQLIEKYNIEQGDLEDPENKVIEYTYEFKGYIFHEYRLPIIFAHLFDCVAVVNRKGTVFEISSNDVTVIGTTLNVEMVKNATTLTRLSIASELVEMKKTIRYMGRTARNTFADGIVSRLEDRAIVVIAEREKQRADTGKGLVHVSKTDAYMKENYPNLRHADVRAGSPEDALFRAGEQAGNNISLNAHKPLGGDRLLN